MVICSKYRPLLLLLELGGNNWWNTWFSWSNCNFRQSCILFQYLCLTGEHCLQWSNYKWSHCQFLVVAEHISQKRTEFTILWWLVIAILPGASVIKLVFVIQSLDSSLALTYSWVEHLYSVGPCQCLLRDRLANPVTCTIKNFMIIIYDCNDSTIVKLVL
jgi:hypothetical protein